jgi:hypothetical protein
MVNKEEIWYISFSIHKGLAPLSTWDVVSLEGESFTGQTDSASTVNRHTPFEGVSVLTDSLLSALYTSLQPPVGPLYITTASCRPSIHHYSLLSTLYALLQPPVCPLYITTASCRPSIHHYSLLSTLYALLQLPVCPLYITTAACLPSKHHDILLSTLYTTP